MLPSSQQNYNCDYSQHVETSLDLAGKNHLSLAFTGDAEAGPGVGALHATPQSS